MLALTLRFKPEGQPLITLRLTPKGQPAYQIEQCTECGNACTPFQHVMIEQEESRDQGNEPDGERVGHRVGLPACAKDTSHLHGLRRCAAMDSRDTMAPGGQDHGNDHRDRNLL